MLRPIFDREALFTWIITNQGTPEQRERYRQQVALYDLFGVSTPDELQAAIDRKEQQEKSKTEAAPRTIFDYVIADPAPAPQAVEPPPAPPETPKLVILETYSMIGLAGIVHRHGRAWLVWALAVALCENHSGRCSVERLRGLLTDNGVCDRQQRRWIEKAFTAGLFHGRRDREYLYPISVHDAGLKLGAKDIGRRSTIRVADLFRRGWHRFVWASYLVTLEGKPLSQQKKHQLTGVEPRLQRLWQAPDEDGETLSYPTFSYSDSPVDPAHVEAVREMTGWALFVSNGKTKQRLPDGRVVHQDISRSLPDGKRSRDIRERFQASSPNMVGLEDDRGNGYSWRMFHETNKQTKRTLRKLAKSDSSNRPMDIFELDKAYGRVKNYRTLPVWTA